MYQRQQFVGNSMDPTSYIRLQATDHNRYLSKIQFFGVYRKSFEVSWLFRAFEHHDLFESITMDVAKMLSPKALLMRISKDLISALSLPEKYSNKRYKHWLKIFASKLQLWSWIILLTAIAWWYHSEYWFEWFRVFGGVTQWSIKNS